MCKDDIEKKTTFAGVSTDYLQISSTLQKTINSAFLNEEPDKNFCTKNLYSEESKYHKLFGKYEFKSLKEHSSEIKNLFTQQNFPKNQQPKKIKFELERFRAFPLYALEDRH